MKKILIPLFLLIVHLASASGQSTSNTIQFTATFNGSNEVPPVASIHHGNGMFALDGNILTYQIFLDLTIRPTAAGVFGPANPFSNSKREIFGLGNFTVALPFLSPGQPSDPGAVIYTGQVTLNEEEIEQLKRGEFYVNFFTTQHPRGELRGQIITIIQLTASLDGANATNNSPFTAQGFFSLGDALECTVFFPVSNFTNPPAFHATQVSIHGPARGTNAGPVFYLSLVDFGAPSPGSPVAYSGTFVLTKKQKEELLNGEWYADAFATSSPDLIFGASEIRGPILPVDSDNDGVPDYIDLYPGTPPGEIVNAEGGSIEQICPCDAPWKNHAQYVNTVRYVAAQFASERLITRQQFKQIVQQAEHSDCGSKRKTQH